MGTWLEDYESGANIARARTDRKIALRDAEEDRVYQAEIRKNQLLKLKEAQEQSDLLKTRQTDQFNLARSLEIGTDPLPANVVADGPPGQTTTKGTVPYAGLDEYTAGTGAYATLETDYTGRETTLKEEHEAALAVLKERQLKLEKFGGEGNIDKQIAMLEKAAKKIQEESKAAGMDGEFYASAMVAKQLLTEENLTVGAYMTPEGNPTVEGIKAWEKATGKKWGEEIARRIADKSSTTNQTIAAYEASITSNANYLAEIKALKDSASSTAKKDIIEKYEADLRKLAEEKAKDIDKLDEAEITRLEGEINNSKVHRQLNRELFGRDIKKLLLERENLVKQFESFSSGDAPDLERATIAQQNIAILDSQLWVDMLEQGITDVALGKSPEIIETVMSEFWAADVKIQKRDDEGDKGKPRWHIYADGKLVKSPTNEMYWSQAQLEKETQKEVSDAYAATVAAADAALNEKLLEGIITPSDMLEHTMTYLGLINATNSAEFIEKLKLQSTIKYSTPDSNDNMIISVGGNFFRYLADPTSGDVDEAGNYPKQLTEITDLSDTMQFNLSKALATNSSYESVEAILSKVPGLQ